MLRYPWDPVDGLTELEWHANPGVELTDEQREAFRDWVRWTPPDAAELAAMKETFKDPDMSRPPPRREELGRPGDAGYAARYSRAAAVVAAANAARYRVVGSSGRGRVGTHMHARSGTR